MPDMFKLSMHPDVGVGGYKCYCCGPADRKHEKKLRRMARRRLQQAAMKEIKNYQQETVDLP